MKLRDVVRRLSPTKQDASGHDPPFGGINVLFAGDFWQLDPPSGGCLSSIPVEYIRNARQYVAKPTVAHGQAIFWHKGLGVVQGVTELTETIRTEDPWLLEVQQQMRAGSLSEDNWHFLHGRPTKVPGSWINGACECGHEACEKLAGKKVDQEKECAICKEHRGNRHRVMNDEDDKRYTEGKFITAPAIFPNNDIKCEVNKHRAQVYAAATKQAITWSQAKDKPSSKVLSDKPKIVEERLCG